MATSSKMSLKLLIDKKEHKVLFAEASKNFVDFLLNLLALPVAAVIKLLGKSTTVGCLANLYESFETLDETYLQPDQHKDSLLQPHIPNQVSNMPFLLPYTSPQTPQPNLYSCSGGLYKCFCVTDSLNATCDCKSLMNRKLKFIAGKFRASNVANSSNEGTGGYVKGVVTYMVMDDLSVFPMSMISSVRLLTKFNIKDFSVLQEKVVEFGVNECLELLKASLLSKAALTDVFIAKQKVKAGVASNKKTNVTSKNKKRRVL